MFLVDLLSNTNREKVKNVQCVVFVRPTKKNVQRIQEELQRPLYSEYHLCMERNDLMTFH